MNSGEYISLIIDTLEESNNPCLIIRNACPMSGKKAQLNAIEMRIAGLHCHAIKNKNANHSINKLKNLRYDR